VTEFNISVDASPVQITMLANSISFLPQQKSSLPGRGSFARGRGLRRRPDRRDRRQNQCCQH